MKTANVSLNANLSPNAAAMLIAYLQPALGSARTEAGREARKELQGIYDQLSAAFTRKDLNEAFDAIGV